MGQSMVIKVVQFYSDNETVVIKLTKVSSKEKNLTHLLRCIVFQLSSEARLGIPLALKQGFWLTASHIKEKQNTLAHTISRNNLKQFYSQAPQTMDKNPIPVPAGLPQKHMYIHVHTTKISRYLVLVCINSMIKTFR